MKFSKAVIQIVAVAASCIASVAGEAKPDDFGILEWVHSAEGGFYNPKQDFRYEIPGDPTSVAGVFATERIEEGEILCQVPWSLLLKSDDPTEEGQLCCGTGAAVAREMRLGEASSYAPYALYLNAQPDGQLPSDWSKEGKHLLQEIVGGTVTETSIPPVEPTEWLTFDWFQRCKADPSDELASKAALLVVQRSDDFYMIPAYDLYNHRNGKWTNTETMTFKGKHHITRATRTIEPGEEIFITYNFCKECQGRRHGYGTAEILRDYGFVERFPQRWHYTEEDYQFDLDYNEFGEMTLKWTKRHKPKEADREKAIIWFNREIRRLRRMKNLRWSDLTNNFEKGNTGGVPKHEWDVAWEFFNANIVALKAAVESLESKVAGDKTCTMEDYYYGGICSNATDVGSHYDPLNFEIDDLDYIAQTCDNEDIMQFETYDVIETQKTNYQVLNFAIQDTDKDVCMDLDDIVQICSNYRPQYHEYAVHAAARFVDEVKRVIFIGGGDSMLLHEALKYPSLELVVGLELDQVVIRKSFKYFHTQPHFDDERVEWWLGDATKSLLLLPKEYWQSFDLVLVDLSETAMSLSVTKDLDVFDALALLLNKDGVMVKNELYLEQFSDIFDHTIQLFYESPIICSQCMAMGSNKVDFLHDTPKDHGIETLLYEPLITDENHLDFLHDYRKNNAREQGECDEEVKQPPPSEVQESSAGFIEIIEAENTSIPLDQSLTGVLSKVVAAEGFTLITVPVYDSGVVLVAMKEGYIVVRLFQAEKYCGFDVTLWGMTYKVDSLRKALVEAVGSKLNSSFRIVVGGMYGSSSWKEDQLMIGPQMVQQRNCDDKEISITGAMDKDIVRAGLLESANLLVKSQDITVVVICGTQSIDECYSSQIIKTHEKVKKVVPIQACSDIENIKGPKEQAKKMYACEKRTLKTLHETFGLKGAKFDMFVVDDSVSHTMLQVMNSILDVPQYRNSWVEFRNVFVAFSANPTQERFRRNFIDRYRKQHKEDPIIRAEMMIEGEGSSIEIDIVTCGDGLATYNLEAMEYQLQDKFKEDKKDISVNLQMLQGGLFPFDENFDGGKKFLQTDYDNEPGQSQYKEQKPLGSQHIFQVVPKTDKNKKEPYQVQLTPEILDTAMEKAVGKIGGKVSGHHHMSDVGDGCVIVFIFDIGQASVVWDGRQHIDLNLFTYEETKDAPEIFLASFMHFASPTHLLEMGLADDLPRGVGRVINFKKDMEENRVMPE